MKFNVQFTFNRYPLRLMHRAVETFDGFGHGVVGRGGPKDDRLPRLAESELRLINRDISKNEEQTKAVSVVLKDASLWQIWPRWLGRPDLGKHRTPISLRLKTFAFTVQ